VGNRGIVEPSSTSKELTVNIKRYQVILGFIAIVITMGIVGQSDFEEAERQEVEYCEMVKLWKQTKGQAGWPAYNGEKMCR
jgi:hypothetical protein